MSTKRAYYSKTIPEFLIENSNDVLSTLIKLNTFDLDLGQRNAWLREIEILKDSLVGIDSGHILLEYTIPRMGKRVDAILILDQVVAVVEFKVGLSHFYKNAIDQVVDYALDLKYFHEESHDAYLVPILVATEARHPEQSRLSFDDDGVAEALCLTPTALRRHLSELAHIDLQTEIDAPKWIRSVYRPTPTIIEAAQVLFRDHTVEDISRNDASAINLEQTTSRIGQIIDEAKLTSTKHICLITGVPGAGKTLAGLAVANSRQRFEEEEHAVFLSGNGPLVIVLQEALARDQHSRGLSRTKAESLRRAKGFIQAIHSFRDDAVSHSDPVHEKVAIFDEAQRAWNSEQLGKFMKSKRGEAGFNISEPQFLLEVMDRHKDWAVVVCLVGEGQEINTGEAGISEWLKVLDKRFRDWHVHTSPRIISDTYARGVNVKQILDNVGTEKVHFDQALHLAVSVRSFRSERLSEFVEALLDDQPSKAISLLRSFSDVYPIAITRDLNIARNWVRNRARGTERFGLVASAGAKRLRPLGIWVDYRNNPIEWFLNSDEDVRSSYGLEIAATEFDVQGLELDWTVVAWDGDLRHNGQQFEHWNFRGSRWEAVSIPDRINYLTNAYRVLLTRSRQGMVIYVPYGDAVDPTRPHAYYDHTFNYLKNLGIPEV